MGRILDSLRQAESPRNGHDKPVAATPASPSAAAPTSALLAEQSVREVEATPDDEEYAYIEVGAPNKKIDGSPAVLAAPVPRKSVPIANVEPPQVTQNAATSRDLTLAVDFEPWSPPLPAHGLPGTEIICYHQPEHPASKQYVALLEQMLTSLPREKPPVVLMAGLASQSGTSTVLLNLAFTACLKHKLRVAIVDANLRQPVLADRLSITASVGMNDVLTGAAALDGGLGKTLYPLLHILPGKMTANPAEILAADALRWLGLRLRDRFDLILMDGPHLGDYPELPALLAACDGMFLVMKHDAVDAADKPRLAKILSRLGSSLKGLIHARLL
ncbi:MAG: CpsD/CapB family tyrosine-protein kinase [Planctomycetes bacterium]|nr:CpsD/CapB family tyrosine-protein kinase [Planctomycetota bacterium]